MNPGLDGTVNRLNVEHANAQHRMLDVRVFDVHFLVKRLYETTPKWHGFLIIKLAAFRAIGGAYMTLHC